MGIQDLKISKKASALAGNEALMSAEAMAEESGGINRFSTKGKVWRLKMAGEEDEKKMGQSIDVVIMGRAPELGLAHQFYKEKWTEGSAESPDCSSQDGIVPDNWIDAPESEKCASCPHQVWGSRMTEDGRKAKACSDHLKMYVILADDVGKADAPIILITVTVNTLKNLDKYRKELLRAGVASPSLVVTTISMDEDASVPCLIFDAKAVIADKNLDSVVAIASEKSWVPKTQTALPNAIDKAALPTHDPDADKAIEGTVVEEKAPSDDQESALDGW